MAEGGAFHPFMEDGRGSAKRSSDVVSKAMRDVEG